LIKKETKKIKAAKEKAIIYPVWPKAKELAATCFIIKCPEGLKQPLLLKRPNRVNYMHFPFEATPKL